ncbi:flavodoxin domain-containing protein [Catenovulum sp. SX2]|uniref:flavodoxin domain-containing protein n=1 Tax=Catenovulum sp. SX2 TaxID=3398614 RepID=UPI003F838DBF
MTDIAILYGSVYGGAEELAETSATRLENAGFAVKLFSDCDLEDVLAANAANWLIISSTTGSGDIPQNIEDVYLGLRDNAPNLSKTGYAVICMGDSSYGETFCEAGKQFDEVMGETMAKRMLDRLEIDACETMDTAAASEAWISQLVDKIKQ